MLRKGTKPNELVNNRKLETFPQKSLSCPQNQWTVFMRDICPLVFFSFFSMSVWTHQILIYIQKTNFPHSKKAILTQAQLHLTGMSEKYLIILLFHQRQPENSLLPVSIQSQLGLAPIFLPVRWLSPAHAFQLNQKPAFKDNAKMRNLPQNPGDVLLPSTHTYSQINSFVFPYPSSKGTSPLLQYDSVQRLKPQDEASSQAFMWKVFQFFSRASSLLLSNFQSECFGASEHHCSRSNPPLSSPLFFPLTTHYSSFPSLSRSFCVHV